MIAKITLRIKLVFIRVKQINILIQPDRSCDFLQGIWRQFVVIV
jgi:hypothetical protein